MSKKCCGNIYNDDEKFCTMCGKKLVDVEEMEQPQVEEAKEEVEQPQVEEAEEAAIEISEEAAQKKLDAMNLPIMNLEEIDKLTADIIGSTKNKEVSAQDTTSEKVVKGERAEEEKKLDTIKSNEETVESTKPDNETAEGTKVDEGKQTDASDEASKKKSAKEIFDEDDEDDEDEDENKASVGLKILGFMSLLIMFCAIGAVVLGLIFIMFNPFYKKYDAGQIVVYPEIGTNTDAGDQSVHALLPEVVLDEEEDKTTEDTAQGNVSEATPEDATPEDAEDNTEDTETSEE